MSAPSSFAAPYRVRFDEAGPDGLVRTSTLLRYAQDLAWAHSTNRGFDRAWYAARGLTWLVRAAEIEVLAPVEYGEVLDTTTAVVGWRRVWARRRTTFETASSHVGARIDIDWVLVDRRGVPARIPSEIEAAFPLVAPAPSLLRLTLAAPPAGADVQRFRVRPQELDPMAHVNNAVYADWLDEAILAAVLAAGGAHGRERSPVAVLPRTVQLEYAAAAEPGVEVESATWSDAAGWSYRLRAGSTELLRARLRPGPGEASGSGGDGVRSLD
ncbi:MAG: acyl-ACP thioesterase domain-containing protein [Chloroflexota bacterium]